MEINETDSWSVPAKIAANPASKTPLREMGLTKETEAALRKAEFETAGHVACASAFSLHVFQAFTPEMISEIKKALGKLGLELEADPDPSR